MCKSRPVILLGIATMALGSLNAGSQTLPTGEKDKQLSVSLTTETLVAERGRPVLAKITVSDAKDYLLPISGNLYPYGYPYGLSGLNGVFGLDGSYGWSCRDGLGRNMAKAERSDTGVGYVFLQAGRTRLATVRLDLGCDLSKPGQYSVTVIRKAPARSNVPPTLSNSISLEVR